MRLFLAISLLIMNVSLFAQHKFVAEGQASALFGFTPEADLGLQVAGRYIPEVNYIFQIDSHQLFDIEASLNLSGAVSSLPFDQYQTFEKLSPYRLWARYSGKQLEIRGGLQKIDFGSATLLRPLQWFNEIDPRDPLQLTNGVYGLLGKYSFLNNANIWIWGLYGNQKTRGFDVLETNPNQPEIGGRIQYPTPDGEIAVSFHHRIANAPDYLLGQSTHTSPLIEVGENRIAVDGKWDKTVGLWFEATHSIKNSNVGILTNQSMLNVGSDYTFGLGNGLTVIAEHLTLAYNDNHFNIDNIAQISATTFTYPLGLFDNISGIVYFNWETEDPILFLNYQHSFKKITGYIMAYYNPGTQQGIRENDFSNPISGPGVRFMLVYNH